MTKSEKVKIVDFPPPQLNEEAVRKIGSKLREQYDQIASEPVPDRFAALLEELENKSSTEQGDS